MDRIFDGKSTLNHIYLYLLCLTGMPCGAEIVKEDKKRILYLNKSIEQFGSGFKRINSLCQDAGIKYSYENTKNGFKFILYRPRFQSDIPNVTLDVTLNGTEMSVLTILKQKPDSSRDEIADKFRKQCEQFREH